MGPLPIESGSERVVICEAIHRRCLLAFDYHGHPRVVAPYCHGKSTRGVDVLRAVQVAGSSPSGGFGFGKLWRLDEVENLHMSGERFVPDDPDYNPNDRGMSFIHCRV